MGTEIKWGAQSSVVTACPSTNGLKNLSNGNHALGAEIDNTSGYQYANFQLSVRGATAFVAGEYINVWFIMAVDGTNYEDGAAGTPGTTPGKPADLVFIPRAVNTQQVMTIRNVLLPPTKFKCLVQNTTGRGFTNTDDENVLVMYKFNEAIATV